MAGGNCSNFKKNGKNASKWQRSKKAIDYRKPKNIKKDEYLNKKGTVVGDYIFAYFQQGLEQFFS